MPGTLFRDGLFLTCDPHHSLVRGDLLVRDGRIVALGPTLEAAHADVVHLAGAWVLPGFVQTHIHLCQTLFRGRADDLALLDWLRTRIWPLEAAHDEASTYASARLGASELLAGGTTTILDMGTVRHTDATFTACAEVGLRAFVGRALMDVPNEAGLSQPMEEGLRGACDEADRWHGRGRLRYAFAPRFVPSCSEGLLREVMAEARRRGCLVHSHASENLDEVALVRQLTGRDNVVYLHDLGMAGPDVLLAHCIHLADHEVALLAASGTRVLHCPSSNLKLASGVARVPELLAAGVHVSLGADGAPCNNRLDAFLELRLAALLPKPRLGPTAMPAATALHLATLRGAEALGLGQDLGSLEPGKLADLVVLDPDDLGALADPDPVSAVVYGLGRDAVRSVWIEGEQVFAGGEVRGWPRHETARLCRAALQVVRGRAGL